MRVSLFFLVPSFIISYCSNLIYFISQNMKKETEKLQTKYFLENDLLL